MKVKRFLWVVVCAAMLIVGTVPGALADTPEPQNEMAVWHPADGTWHVALNNSAAPNEPFLIAQTGQLNDVPVPADYDGNGVTDFAVWRPSDNRFYINLEQNDWAVSTQTMIVSFGVPGLGLYPVPGDYDGDGKDEPAVWNPKDGWWYVALKAKANAGQPINIPVPITNTGGGVVSDQSILSAQYGQMGDIPVPADYDGDGKVEFAVRGLEGTEYYTHISLNNESFSQASADGTSLSIFMGLMDDTPVPADYDGDGIDEVAQWRPDTGEWFVNLGNQPTTGGPLLTGQTGMLGDIPVPADYDGDGAAEFAVWRPSTTTFYVSLGNTDWGASPTMIVPMGQPGDVPVPADYDND